MKVFLSSRARKVLDDSPPELKRRLEARIEELIESPYPTGCKKLKGAPNSYRLRVGDYRILYTIIDGKTILVFNIATRGTSYE